MEVELEKIKKKYSRTWMKTNEEIGKDITDCLNELKELGYKVKSLKISPVPDFIEFDVVKVGENNERSKFIR